MINFQKFKYRTFQRTLLPLAAVFLGVFILLNISFNPINQTPPSITSPSLSRNDLPFCQDHDPSVWHPAVKKDNSGQVICAYGHEHGDPPPPWVNQAGYKVGFDQMAGFMANTSEMENILKHPGMKGFEATIAGVQVYLRIHLAPNPLDRAARYHSYELFLKDPSGGISHFQGWVDGGDPTLDRIPYKDSTFGDQGNDPRRRPLVWAATRHACIVDRTWCSELWSMTTSPWGPEIIWGVTESTSFFKLGETYEADISHWDLSGSLGTERSLGLTIYRDPQDLARRGVNQVLVGKVWATQFGQIVAGADDPICFQKTTKFGAGYQNICLENTISPTLPQIKGIDTTVVKKFDSTGVKIPN